MFTYDEVFWLNLTNLALGLATLVCLLVIAYTTVKEIRQRIRARANVAEFEKADDHAFVIDGLGVTMADGGKKVDTDEVLVVTEDGIESVPANKASDQRR